MKTYLNLAALMLVAVWAISYFFFAVGPVSHLVLAMALLVALLNLIQAGFNSDSAE